MGRGLIEARRVCRRRAREARESLTAQQRLVASDRISRNILASSLYRSARRVALYFATPFEVDVTAVILDAFATDREVFVPVLESPAEMRFARLVPDSAIAPNRFGIWEPDHRADRIDARQLDLVVTPLVAFDDRGNRMGMGAGFYDRSFRFLRRRSVWFHPKLLGAAFACQSVESIPTEAWDIPLFAVATEHDVKRFR